MRMPFVTLAVIAFTSLHSDAQGWTRFRGPNGSGVVETTGLPVEFGAEENLHWTAEVPFGSSSPVLAEEVIYLTGSNDSELILVCLDRTTGEERWMRPFERARESGTYAANDDASPSPVTDGVNVYAFFPERGLVSCDPDGELRWELPLGPFSSFYGMASSPILAGDAVVLQCDQQRGSFLVAVDAATGEPRWRTERTGIIESWATPVLLTGSDAPDTLVLFGSYTVCGYSLETGAELWRAAGLGYAPSSSPIADGERLFVCAPNHTEQPMPSFESLVADYDADGNGTLEAAELTGQVIGEHFGWIDADQDDVIDVEEYASVEEAMRSRDYGLVALDLGVAAGEGETDSTEAGAIPGGDPGRGPREAWRYKRSLPSISTPLLYDGVLYVVREGGIVTTLDPATGEVMKSGRLGHGGSQQYPSPVAGDGKVFIASNSGEVAVLSAGPEWEILSINDLGDEIHATPAIGDGSLYVRTRSALHCFRGTSN